MPNFEVLDARIASALNKIIHNSHFKRRISLEEQKAQKQDRFLRGRQIAYLIYDHFLVITICEGWSAMLSCSSSALSLLVFSLSTSLSNRLTHAPSSIVASQLTTVEFQRVFYAPPGDKIRSRKT